MLSTTVARSRPLLRRGLATAVNDRKITILECAARDGLQNEATIVPLATKLELVRRLAETGLTYIEAGSFVPPKWIPQMADTRQLLPQLPHGASMNFPVLTPNVRAVDDIVSSGSLPYLKEVIVFAAASEGFSKANTNCTVEESIDRMAATAAKALALGLRVRGSISCVVGSPFERGVTDPAFVRDIAKKMLEAGCYNIALGDTIGVGNPGTIRALLDEVMKDVPVELIAIHSHDTYGGGVASVIAAVEAGVRIVDASAGGLGGCPYAPGATGNVATEDVVYALHGMGYETGMDLEALSLVGEWISGEVGRKNSSRAGSALARKLRAAQAKV